MTPIQKFDTAVKDYLDNLKNVGAGEKTVHNYTRRLSFFRTFWADTNPSEDPTVQDIQNWRDSLIESGCKLTTVRQYMKELSQFFTAMTDPTLPIEQRYEQNPVSKRIIPDTRKIEKRPYDELLSDSDVLKLWQNTCKAKRRGDLWARNYAIVILLLTTEMRNAELLSLTPRDLDWENEEITIENGKGNKYRVVDFPEIAQTAVKLYLSSKIRPHSVSDTEPLFGTTADETGHRSENSPAWKRGTSQWLSGVVERHVKAVTGVSSIRTHDLRHVGARLDLNMGMSFEELQAKLGHESVATTQIYSGKLTARRKRRQTASVFAERDEQTKRNAAMLSVG